MIHAPGSTDTRVWNNTSPTRSLSLWIQDNSVPTAVTPATLRVCTQVQKWSAEHGLS